MTIKNTFATLSAGLLLLSSFSPASNLSPTTAQTWTLRALITELEDNHYADHRYNDAMSADHLETYLDRLDPSHLYFTASDAAEFQRPEKKIALRASRKREKEGEGKERKKQVSGHERG